MATRVHNMPKNSEKIIFHLPTRGAIAPYPPPSAIPSGDAWEQEPYNFTKPPSAFKFMKISMRCWHFHRLIFHVKYQSEKRYPLNFLSLRSISAPMQHRTSSIYSLDTPIVQYFQLY